MKIAVIAANGRTGKEFVALALEAGHNISAGVHGNNNLDNHPNLNALKCDATKPEDVEKLIDGQDAVVSFIGHVKNSPANVQSNAIANTIKAMTKKDMKRLVSLTGTGVRRPGDKITITDRILNISISIIDPKRVKDGINHFKIIEKSNLDWTVIRVLKLQNNKTKPYTLKINGPTKPYVSRVEVAQACLEVLENDSFVHEAPIISNN